MDSEHEYGVPKGYSLEYGRAEPSRVKALAKKLIEEDKFSDEINQLMKEYSKACSGVLNNTYPIEEMFKIKKQLDALFFQTFGEHLVLSPVMLNYIVNSWDEAEELIKNDPDYKLP